MFRLSIERLSDGSILELTHDEGKYQLTQVDGIELPEIDMSTYDIASIDGSQVSNIKMPDREITVTIFIRGDVERNRRAIHQLCRVRSVMRLHFITDGGSRYIDGYVKSIDSNRFDNLVEMDITFICPDPYFKAEQGVIVDMSRTYGAFFFPFGMNRVVAVQDLLRTATVNSVSENETGIIIRVMFLAQARGLRITNADTGEYLTIEYNYFYDGDILEINTIDGQKDVMLYHNDEQKSLIAYVLDGSTFFQLQSGDNRFNYVLKGTTGDYNPQNVNAEMEFDFTPIYMEL